MTRPIRLTIVLSTVVALVVVVSGLIGWRLIVRDVNDAVPQADLFGDASRSASSSAAPSPSGSPTPPPGSDIKGPLNILIVGVDTRVSKPGWIPHSDAVMILHVNAGLTQAYLTSLPRDLVVDVPAFPPSGFGGSRTKLTHAMSYGSQVPGSKKPNPAQGFALLAKTVSAYTGIKRFDAGAILTFSGMVRVVQAVGGIDLYVDQVVTSIHMRPDGKYRTVCGSCSHGYSGPQMTYTVGTRHLVGWQVLDYSRQRYLPSGDYARQRHQRQIIKALVTKMFGLNLATNPGRISAILRTLGDTLVFDGRGRTPVEFAYALRNLRGSSVTLVGLPGSAVFSGGQYLGEQLSGVQASYFAALRKDSLATFLAGHKELVNNDPRPKA